MKNINLLILIGIIVASCSSGGGDDTEPPKENKAPGKVATLTYPTNNLLCISNTLEFKWDAATDPDGDPVSYILEISKDNQFLSIDQSVAASSNFSSLSSLMYSFLMESLNWSSCPLVSMIRTKNRNSSIVVLILVCIQINSQ